MRQLDLPVDLPAALELDLPAVPGSLSIARNRLELWLAETGAGHDDEFAIKLAVSEACANAVEHAYSPEHAYCAEGASGFRVRAERSSGVVVIHVSDRGRWRAPRASRNGLGLLIMGRLMDSLDVQRTSTGTTVRMRKASRPTAA
ncbi:MAG TPA: ATP-binding protein [Solirubrobacteraceae bacterium]|nr:ATP-binding protein [Solirubrobacteraceae bacterium]